MSWIMIEYKCPDCGVFESLESRPAPDTVKHECGAEAPRIMSAPIGYCNGITVTSSTAHVKDKPPDAMSTRLLGEGQPRSEFKAERRRHWQNKDYNTDCDNGLRDRKVFV